MVKELDVYVPSPGKNELFPKAAPPPPPPPPPPYKFPLLFTVTGLATCKAVPPAPPADPFPAPEGVPAPPAPPFPPRPIIVPLFISVTVSVGLNSLGILKDADELEELIVIPGLTVYVISVFPAK